MESVAKPYEKFHHNTNNSFIAYPLNEFSTIVFDWPCTHNFGYHIKKMFQTRKRERERVFRNKRKEMGLASDQNLWVYSPFGPS